MVEEKYVVLNINLFFIECCVLDGEFEVKSVIKFLRGGEKNLCKYFRLFRVIYLVIKLIKVY